MKEEVHAVMKNTYMVHIISFQRPGWEVAVDLIPSPPM